MSKFIEMLSGSLVVAGVVLSGCADGEGSGAAEPIAHVALDSGLTVSFYEPVPGAIEIAQIAPRGVAMASADLRAVDLYASLAPGQPVPAALRAAQARLDASRAARGETIAPRQQQSNLGPIALSSFIDNKTVDDKWFVDTYCGSDTTYGYGFPDIQRCKYDLTDPFSSSFNDTDHELVAACADVGNVVLQTLAPVFHSWDLLENHCILYRWESAWINDNAASEVVGVNGANRYHYSARYWD